MNFYARWCLMGFHINVYGMTLSKPETPPILILTEPNMKCLPTIKKRMLIMRLIRVEAWDDQPEPIVVNAPHPDAV